MSAADVPVTEDATSSTTIGVTGQRRRWSVTRWGAIEPWGGDDPTPGSLDWYVAADDRWHVPAQEASIRQRRIDGTPVVETRVRVPDGDAIQRVWAAPDADGVALVEFENASPLPFAVAVSGDHIVTERPPSAVPVEGIDLPHDAIVLPVGHRSSVRVAVGAVGALPDVPPPMSVVRGWTRIVEQASRFVLPDPAIAESVVAARSDLLLEGPVAAERDPIGFLLDAGELVRCGDAAEPWLVEMIPPLEALLAGHRTGWFRRHRPATAAPELADAVVATRRVAGAAADERAIADLDRVLEQLAVAPYDAPVALAELRRGAGDAGPDAVDSVGRFVRRVERWFARDGDLLPGGIPTTWLGADFEVHGLPIGAEGSVGFAVRWHGERPAVLWEQRGAARTLTASSVDAGWSTDARSGEALWSVPPNATLARRPISFTVEGVSRDDD